MKKFLLVFSLILSIALYTNAQVIQSSAATQSSVEKNTGEKFYLSGCVTAKNELSSEEVVIKKNVKIQQVTGTAQAGFWIEKEGVKFKIFTTNAASVGFVLPPGTYKAYPNKKKNSSASAATVCINIVLQ